MFRFLRFFVRLLFVNVFIIFFLFEVILCKCRFFLFLRVDIVCVIKLIVLDDDGRDFNLLFI